MENLHNIYTSFDLEMVKHVHRLGIQNHVRNGWQRIQN